MNVKLKGLIDTILCRYLRKKRAVRKVAIKSITFPEKKKIL